MIIDEQFAMIGDGIALIGGSDDTDNVPPKLSIAETLIQVNHARNSSHCTTSTEEKCFDQFIDGWLGPNEGASG